MGRQQRNKELLQTFTMLFPDDGPSTLSALFSGETSGLVCLSRQPQFFTILLLASRLSDIHFKTSTISIITDIAFNRISFTQIKFCQTFAKFSSPWNTPNQPNNHYCHPSTGEIPLIIFAATIVVQFLCLFWLLIIQTAKDPFESLLEILSQEGIKVSLLPWYGSWVYAYLT